VLRALRFSAAVDPLIFLSKKPRCREWRYLLPMACLLVWVLGITRLSHLARVYRIQGMAVVVIGYERGLVACWLGGFFIKTKHHSPLN